MVAGNGRGRSVENPLTEESGAVSAALTGEEHRLATFLRLFGGFGFGAVLFYIAPLFFEATRDLFAHAPFVTNSAVKMGTLGLLAFVAAADVRKYRVLVGIVVAAHIISEVAVLAVLAFGRVTEVSHIGTTDVPVRTMLWASVVLDAVLLAVIVGFKRSADRARYGARYFSPAQMRTAMALADVLVKGEDEIVPPQDVAANVDKALATMRAKGRWLAKLALVAMEWFPLVKLRAPFSLMRPEARLDFIKRHFYQDVAMRLAPRFMRTIVQGMIRFSKQLVYLGYYSDKRTFDAVGYTPFSERVPEDQTKQSWEKYLLDVRTGSRSPLQMYDPGRDTTRIDSEIVVVGSGAGGAIMASELVRQGHDVLLLERGPHVDRGSFVEDEVEMLNKLYGDGALQLTRDFGLQVIQGSCVGGSTVVNNAVCFDAPERVLDRWLEPAGANAGFDRGALARSFVAVNQLLGAKVQPDSRVNPGFGHFERGIRALGLQAPPNELAAVRVNIDGCLGCGYCNIGCAYGKKLSMLDHVLPRAQTMKGAGRLRIMADCDVQKLAGRGRRVTHLECLRGDRPLRVRANKVVVACGAIHSSILLMRSGMGGRRVGQGLGMNIGAPLTADFPGIVNAHAGLQISHYLTQSPELGYILETWWNPPTSQALAMPGWFETHYHNMKRYAHMVGVGVLVPSDAKGRVKSGGLTGRTIDFKPTKKDVDRIIDAVVKAGEIFLAAGAERVLPHTFQELSYTSADDMKRNFPAQVRDAGDLFLGTGHPQGGNAMSEVPGRGVVDGRLRVHGYDNVWIADASVFPDAIGVNPQVTVMALAHYGAQHVAET